MPEIVKCEVDARLELYRVEVEFLKEQLIKSYKIIHVQDLENKKLKEELKIVNAA